MTVEAVLGLVAWMTLNIWLFRLGAFWRILGVNVTKRATIAYLCQVPGVDRRTCADSPSVIPACVRHVPVS
jgi:hypothetical protein